MELCLGERRGESLWPEGERQMFLFYKGKRMGRMCSEHCAAGGGEMKNSNKQKMRNSKKGFNEILCLDKEEID